MAQVAEVDLEAASCARCAFPNEQLSDCYTTMHAACAYPFDSSSCDLEKACLEEKPKRT